MLGYTVVDAATVVATHLSELLKSNAHELFGHEECQHLLDRLASSSPKLVEEVTPKLLPMSVVARVLQNLLEENIPIRNIRKIAEILAENGPKSQDPDVLSAAVRVALGRSIVQSVAGTRAELPVLTLDPELERILNESTEDGSNAGLEPAMVERLHQSLSEKAQSQEIAGEPAVLLVTPQVRPWMSRMMHGRYKEAQFFSELFADALDACNQGTVALAIDQRNQAVSDFQSDQIDRIQIVPTKIGHRRVAIDWLRHRLRYRCRFYCDPSRQECAYCGKAQECKIRHTGNQSQNTYYDRRYRKRSGIAKELREHLLSHILRPGNAGNDDCNCSRQQQ